MLKDILVATTGCGDDGAAVATAIALAGETSAHVAVLVQIQIQVPIPDLGAMGLYPVGNFSQAFEEAHRQGQAARARWQAVLEKSGVPGEVRLEQAFTASLPDTAAMQARYCDMSLIGLAARDTLPVPLHDQFARLLLGSGRPVLAVPPGWLPRPFGRVAIGWKPGAPASRAVHDAIAWFPGAREVDVICVDPHRAIDGHGDEPGADLATHLARHGVRVTIHCAESDGRDPGEVLLQRARELGADLLVAGGYGHSRLREWILGGTTRYLLERTGLPVLFSH